MNTILEAYFNDNMIINKGEITLVGNSTYDGCTKYHRGLNVHDSSYLDYTNIDNININYSISFIINFLNIRDMTLFAIGNISYKIINKMINVCMNDVIIDPDIILLNNSDNYKFIISYKNNNMVFSIYNTVYSSTYIPNFIFNTFRILDSMNYSDLYIDAIKFYSIEPDLPNITDSPSEWTFVDGKLTLTNTYKGPKYEMYNHTYNMLQTSLYDFSILEDIHGKHLIRALSMYDNKTNFIRQENIPTLYTLLDWVIDPEVNNGHPHKILVDYSNSTNKLSIPLPLIVFKIDNLLNDGDPRIGIEEDSNIAPYPDRIFKINPELNDGDPFIVTDEHLDISPYPDRIFKIDSTINNSDPYLIEFDDIIIRPFPINNFWIEEGVNEGDPLIGLNYIPDGAFKNMSSLSSIHNLNNVEFIGSNSFNKVPLLNEVILSEECVYNQTTFDKHIIINKE